MKNPANLAAKLSQIQETWSPRVVGEFNGHDLRVSKLEGEYIWHAHPQSDEVFLVLTGSLAIELPERTVQMGPGDIFVVPAGVQHKPVADGLVEVLVLNRSGEPTTGDTPASERTVADPQPI